MGGQQAGSGLGNLPSRVYKHFGLMFKKICIGYSDDATVEAMRQDAQQRIDNANQTNTKPEGKP
jgi:hypothetical protein